MSALLQQYPTQTYRDTSFRNMKLLNSKDVQEGRKRGDEELAQRVQKLKNEELTLTRKVNEARLDTESKIAKIEEEFKSYENKILLMKRELTQEVEALELRRNEALKPTVERERAIHKAEVEFSEKESDFEKYKIELESSLVSKINLMSKTRSEYEDKKRRFDILNDNLVVREKKLEEGNSDLDRNIAAKESRLRDEWKRLRSFFEEEDKKLNKKKNIFNK